MPTERRICCMPFLYFHSRPVRPASPSSPFELAAEPSNSNRDYTSDHAEHSPPARPRPLSQIQPVQTIANIAPQAPGEVTSHLGGAAVPAPDLEPQQPTYGYLTASQSTPNMDPPLLDDEDTVLHHPTRGSLSPDLPIHPTGVFQIPRQIDPIRQPFNPKPPRGFHPFRLSSREPPLPLRRARPSIDSPIYTGRPTRQQAEGPPDHVPKELDSSWLGGHPAAPTSSPPIASQSSLQYPQSAEPPIRFHHPTYLSPISEQQISPSTATFSPLHLPPLRRPLPVHTTTDPLTIPSHHQRRSLSTTRANPSHPPPFEPHRQSRPNYAFQAPETLSLPVPPHLNIQYSDSENEGEEDVLEMRRTRTTRSI